MALRFLALSLDSSLRSMTLNITDMYDCVPGLSSPFSGELNFSPQQNLNLNGVSLERQVDRSSGGSRKKVLIQSQGALIFEND